MTTTTTPTTPANHPATIPAVPIGTAAVTVANELPNRVLIDKLVASKIYQDYERAFSDATGLPVALRPVESWQLPHHGQRHENPFCALLGGQSRTCAACLQLQERLAQAAQVAPATLQCRFGLCDTAVPVRIGHRLVGFLHTGQVLSHKPTPERFRRALRQIQQLGVPCEVAQLRAAFEQSRVLTPREQQSVSRLLQIFAEHLALIGNQIVVQHENAEPPVITKAKSFIRDHLSEPLSLGTVARAVNTSTFYFCKLFKRVTGVNFTDYVSRLRIERAKGLLLNPNLRVSEIAFEVGFQSLTHFNRVFKRIAGESPTEYRSHLPTA
jgi:AraC-like DNA-binding protein/ligand-binding sensor protein